MMTIPEAWAATPSGRIRARGLKLPLEGTPGSFNAITDIDGIEVGYATLVSGTGRLVRGEGPVRTGVTAILPRGRVGATIPVAAGSYSLNGNGELTGVAWVEESGQCEGPITITNTHSVGVARDACVRWLVDRHPAMSQLWGLPVAGETYDGELNDINGFHVTHEHVFVAIDNARGGPLELGSLGGGTGMICYDFKGGSGSSSRRVNAGGQWTIGAFVQANFGARRELTVLGVPVGRHLPGGEVRSMPAGSVIAIIATDAPLLPHQLKRLARRVPLGLARTGAVGHNGSGDIFLALSTANETAFASGDEPRSIAFLPNAAFNPLFEAAVQVVEEAVLDAMIPNQAMTGANDLTVRALPHGELIDLLRRYGRM
jgi:L-aminopeptidase/D-esterase-like protein